MATLTRKPVITGKPPITVDEYDRMVESGALPEDSRVELIEGELVAKMSQGVKHTTSAEKCRRMIERLLAAGWHCRIERPVRIPSKNSETQPDVSIVRGDIDDYDDHHPGPGEISMVVEIALSSLADDRAMAVVYGGGGMPVYWIVNLVDRQLEVYSNPAGGAYPAPVWLGKSESVDLVIDGQIVGQIAVADLLPRRS